MLKSLAIAALSAAVFTANAAEVTLHGDNFDFTFDAATSFGMASVAGDKLTFLPVNFVAESNGNGFVTARETLNITITARNESTADIEEISVLEKGDYQLAGDDAYVKVSSRIEVSNETEGNDTVVNTQQTDNITTPNDLTLTDWSLNPIADLSAWGEVSSVTVQLQNGLVAFAGSDSLAFVQKKSVQNAVTVVVNEVPVPAAAWLFGSALIALGLRKSA